MHLLRDVRRREVDDDALGHRRDHAAHAAHEDALHVRREPRARELDVDEPRAGEPAGKRSHA